MPLTDTAIRKAKPRDKPRKLYDSRGLYLEIATRGTKAWRFKYRYDHDFDPAAAIPKRLPEFAVRGTPGAERRRGLVARIDVDEDGALGVQRDREPEREVAPGVPGRSPIDSPGQESAFDAERLERPDLLRLGR